MDCSTPGFTKHHQLLELTQTHVHQVGDAIQPSHPLCPLLFLPSVFPSIRVFPNKSVLRIRWPKYWSFTFSISPSNEYLGFISFRIIWFDLFAVQILQLKKKKKIFFLKSNCDRTAACDLIDKAEGRPRVSKGSPPEVLGSERNFPEVQGRSREPENSKDYPGHPAMVLARLGLRI